MLFDRLCGWRDKSYLYRYVVEILKIILALTLLILHNTLSIRVLIDSIIILPPAAMALMIFSVNSVVVLAVFFALYTLYYGMIPIAVEGCRDNSIEKRSATFIYRHRLTIALLLAVLIPIASAIRMSRIIFGKLDITRVAYLIKTLPLYQHTWLEIPGIAIGIIASAYGHREKLCTTMLATSIAVLALAAYTETALIMGWIKPLATP